MNNQKGSTLLVVLSLILFVTVIGTGLFALFMQTMPGRIEMREEAFTKIKLETVAYETLNALEADITGDYPYDDFMNVTIVEVENNHYELTVIYDHEDTPLTLRMLFDYNDETGIYTIIQKGF